MPVIFADDCWAAVSDADFELCFRNEMQQIFGTGLSVLPPDHKVFSSFYILPGTLPTEWNNEPLEGIDYDGETVVIFSNNDYGCGWENYASPETIENSFQMGVNIAMFAYQQSCLTINILVNQGTFTVGNTAKIGVEVDNPGSATTTDVRICVKLPGEVYVPIVKLNDFTIPAGTLGPVNLLSYTFTGGEPEGTYEAIGRLLHPCSGEYLSEDIEPFVFDKP
ncbi:MAG: DUF4159 domain-containing protein [Nitrospirota bacterium]